jgi:pyruvate,water dikinase
MQELGMRFVSSGHLQTWDDILLPLDTELDDFLADPGSWRDTIAERRAMLAVLITKVPPFIVDGSYPSIDAFVSGESTGEVPLAGVGETLSGFGVSPGVHTGLVKVVQSIEDDVDIEPGDVLVALTTDSSWGALFLSAGAVIGQTGAAVSHAAIVSRELGIPAVVSVASAMDKLRTGMTVKVDGSTGVVTVLAVPAN